MLFPSEEGYMLKNTEAIICFILLSHQFSDRSDRFWYNLIWNSKLIKKRYYILRYILFSHQFSDRSYGSYII